MNLPPDHPLSSVHDELSDLVESLNALLQSASDDSSEFARVLGRVAKKYGMTRLARETGLSRESLYKTLSGHSSPEFSTILKIIRALNLNFAVTNNISIDR